MSGYTKLFADIVRSTIWQESKETKLVWITMLAIKDRWHTVNSSIPGLAKDAGVTIQECEGALRVLSSPDPYSRSKEFEGRRIEETRGGWKILNGEYYREKLSLEDRREYQRIKAKEYRDRKKSVDTASTPSTLESTSDTYQITDYRVQSTNKKEYCSLPKIQSLGKEEFEKLEAHARSHGRNSDLPLPVTKIGKEALMAIGGFSVICDATSYTKPKVLSAFLEKYSLLTQSQKQVASNV